MEDSQATASVTSPMSHLTSQVFWTPVHQLVWTVVGQQCRWCGCGCGGVNPATSVKLLVSHTHSRTHTQTHAYTYTHICMQHTE